MKEPRKRKKKAAKKKPAAKAKPWKPDERQRRFIEYFDQCGVATVAYIRAGYSERGAQQGSSTLLSNPKVRAAVDKLSAERTKRLSFNADTVLRELATLATVTVGDFLNMETGEIREDLHNLPSYALGAIRSLEIVKGIDGLGRDVTVTKFKLHDRLKAIVAAGKHKDVQAFLEKLEVSSDFGTAMDEAEARMAEARENG